MFHFHESFSVRAQLYHICTDGTVIAYDSCCTWEHLIFLLLHTCDVLYYQSSSTQDVQHFCCYLQNYGYCYASCISRLDSSNKFWMSSFYSACMYAVIQASFQPINTSIHLHRWGLTKEKTNKTHKNLACQFSSFFVSLPLQTSVVMTDK